MEKFTDIGDHSRLTERFFGCTRCVLARTG